METRIPSAPTLLLIETSEDHARFFQRIFAKVALHWQIHWVKDGAAAVHKMVYDSIPHLLVTNLNTPGLAGVEVIEWVRNIRCPHHVSILVFDVVPTGPTYQRLLELDVKDFLDKRSDGEKSRQVIKQLVVQAESQLHQAVPIKQQTKSPTPGFSRTHFRTLKSNTPSGSEQAIRVQ